MISHTFLLPKVLRIWMLSEIFWSLVKSLSFSLTSVLTPRQLINFKRWHVEIRGKRIVDLRLFVHHMFYIASKFLKFLMLYAIFTNVKFVRLWYFSRSMYQCYLKDQYSKGNQYITFINIFKMPKTHYVNTFNKKLSILKFNLKSELNFHCAAFKWSAK